MLYSGCATNDLEGVDCRDRSVLYSGCATNDLEGVEREPIDLVNIGLAARRVRSVEDLPGMLPAMRLKTAKREPARWEGAKRKNGRRRRIRERGV